MNTILLIAGILVAADSASPPTVPADLDLSGVRSVVVQHNGRWMPLDTLARDMVESVTGLDRLDGQDPVATLLAWTFDPMAWQQAPLIRIANAELRHELQLPSDQRVFSYTQLINHAPLLALIDSLEHIEAGRKLDPLEAKASDISETLMTLQAIFRQSVIKPIPDPRDPKGAWQAIVVHQHQAGHEDRVETAWAAMGGAFRNGDARAFATAGRDLTFALAGLPSAYRPSPDRIATELTYNRARPYTIAWIIMLAGAVLSIVNLLAPRKVFAVLSMAALVAGFGVLTWGMSMRWQIAGRIPASNMYESLLFLSWGTGAFAIISLMIFRDRMVPMTASVMGAISLMLADCLPMDHFIRPITPVLLDTVWMSIHVPVIMVSYSVLALAVLIAHVQLFTLALAPSARKLSEKLDSLHYWYVHVGSILLTAGILTGSMWAASSWGRYWGWDPKEVWSLVALLGYLTILHVRAEHAAIPRWGWGLAAVLIAFVMVMVLPKFAPLSLSKVGAFAAVIAATFYFVFACGYFATAVKSILAFWMIIMTYLGVNYVLGSGLHSYGFGTGAMANYMMLTGVADLGLVAILWSIRSLRGRSRSFQSPAFQGGVAAQM